MTPSKPDRETSDPNRADPNGSGSANAGWGSVGNVDNRYGGNLAVGPGASAGNTINYGAVTVVPGATEIAVLREQLTEIITSGTARAQATDSRSIGEALDQVAELDEEVHSPQPRPGVVADLLQKLSVMVKPVASLAESVDHIAHVLGPHLGLS